MLVDANLLLYAVDESSVHHQRAREWLTEKLNGHRRVDLSLVRPQATAPG